MATMWVSWVEVGDVQTDAPFSVFLFPPRDDERETRPHPHLRRAPLGCGRGHSLGFRAPCAQPHARSAWP